MTSTGRPRDSWTPVGERRRDRVVSVLFVCTANLCRSPMAEALARRDVRERHLPARVASAGTHALPGAIPDEVVTALSRLGLEAPTDAGRLCTPDLVAGHDLVVAMAREHVRALVSENPGAFGRVLTLKEVVRRGEARGARRARTPFASWLAGVTAGRRTEDLLGRSPVDDVSDPMGRRQAVFDATAEELHDLVGRLVGLVWPAG